MRCSRLIALLVLALSFGSGWLVRAQTDMPGAYDVFLRGTTIYFVDARTGLSAVSEAGGAGHVLTARGVLFAEEGSGGARLALPDGRIEPYQTIPDANADRVVHWIVSRNQRWLVWSVSTREGSSLSSDLFIADTTAGAISSLVLHTSSQQGLGVLPLNVTDDGLHIFYSRRADLFETPLSGGAVREMIQLDVTTTASKALPDMPGCPCPAAISAEGRRFVWLAANPNGGFDVHTWDLSLGRETVIPPPQTSHREASDLLIGADGAQAIYVTSGGRRFSLVLADLERGEQQIVNGALTQALRPIRLESQSVLLVGVAGDGTYKIALTDGALTQVSAFTYLGLLAGN